LQRRTVYICEAASLTSEGGVEIGELKSNHARRNIKITSATVKALRERKAFAAREGLAECPLVFPSKQGYVLGASNFTAKTWGPIRKKAAITKRFHDLRHTMATTLLKNNIHPKVVQERLGHASIVLTLDTYSAFIPSMQTGAAEALEKNFKRLSRKKAA
jgi:integrase